ncbi:Holliday junction branch migration protein RuvA [Microbacterium aerolatum]|uniref:Holliday junction branch migration complex subunit RuvA n=1 Tax=Microbacterium aerolatum TaxID=153731 RepID=A0A511AD22_9MICO|nr:Holliday junction branch migration protein RuvA [Microbacterium aerolatum]MCK3768132.1 Holliday junction branch migration protein RuvA [Microbacterium aerolatum]GEK86068.1 Holliday junction ATP-dependent DNA helicase RuvA [Microbacterium aerolatum]GGB27141.1 Holliday junction ATP-dependent DNA helicase RuvA [Microbacterium aerolatum]
MISSLRGTVLSTGADHVVVEVGGVGFFVFVPADVAHTARTGEQLRLHTSLIVREDALTLFGFAEPLELEVFTQLLSVTGVGPKSALGVLGHLTVDQIAGAVADDDDAPFRRVSGIGPKTAKLIVVQLAGKLQPPAAAPAGRPASAADAVVAQVTAALVGLGWSEKVAGEAATETADSASEADRESVPALLRQTLAALGPAKAGGARG